jgi:hypothetical protein
MESNIKGDRSKGKHLQFELALVMPVYNEEQCIAEVVQSWCEELVKLGIDFRMIILNDGSQVGLFPTSRAPSSTLKVPKALSSKSCLGFSTDLITETWPAK